MPVQTRAKAPADRVYSSPAAQQQVKFRARKQNVRSRRSLGAPQKSRQQTLTQIDFVSREEAWNLDDDIENEIYEEVHTRIQKRRRTEGDAPSSTSKFHTQTLTQLEFVSTPASRLEDLDDVGNHFPNDSTEVKQEIFASTAGNMGPPKTPSRRRVYEVPSSQSPSSPASVRSQHFVSTRSPLKALDVNVQLQPLTTLQEQNTRESPKVKSEIQDTFEYENESQQSMIPQTPKYSSSPTKNFNPDSGPRPSIDTQKNIKDEIQDSDEEDEDLDTYEDDLVQESQLNHSTLEPSSQIDNRVLNPISSDTQEAEEQLQSTILQFTQQQIPSTCEGQEQSHIRPSQATTVSLTETQPPSSSPIFSRRPRYEMPADVISTGEDQGLTLIPDSPSHQLASGLSLSPTLSRPPLSTQRGTMGYASSRETQDGPLVPCSLTLSQILTRSQMLPESLMNESVPAPPLLIEDSDCEE